MLRIFTHQTRPILTRQHFAGYALLLPLVAASGCSGCESKTSSTTSFSPSELGSPPTQRQNGFKTQEVPESSAIEADNSSRFEPAPAGARTTSNGESNTASTQRTSTTAPSSEATHGESDNGSVTNESGNNGGHPGAKNHKATGDHAKALSPSESIAAATQLKQRSDKAASKKDYGAAFELATQAWNSIRQFPNDAECREMSVQLERRIDELAKLANTQHGVISKNKPLILR